MGKRIRFWREWQVEILPVRRPERILNHGWTRIDTDFPEKTLTRISRIDTNSNPAVPVPFRDHSGNSRHVLYPCRSFVWSRDELIALVSMPAGAIAMDKLVAIRSQQRVNDAVPGDDPFLAAVSQNEGRITGLFGDEILSRVTGAEGAQNILAFNH